MDTVEKQLRQIVARLGNISEDFDPTLHFFRDLGVESTKALELLMDIEETFEITLDDDDYNQVENLKQMVQLVQSLTA